MLGEVVWNTTMRDAPPILQSPKSRKLREKTTSRRAPCAESRAGQGATGSATTRRPASGRLNPWAEGRGGLRARGPSAAPPSRCGEGKGRPEQLGSELAVGCSPSESVRVLAGAGRWLQSVRVRPSLGRGWLLAEVRPSLGRGWLLAARSRKGARPPFVRPLGRREHYQKLQNLYKKNTSEDLRLFRASRLS
jgi:hypothetical protein